MMRSAPSSELACPVNPPTAPVTPAAEISDVVFGWPRERAFLRIRHLAIARGEKIFLHGPSGCGKSTLLGLIGGVLEPQSGRIAVLGTDIATLGGRARDRVRAAHLGLIFQMFNLIPWLSVLENVLLPLHFSPERRARLAARARPAKEEARRLLGALGLGDDSLLQRSVTSLSQGQQQRVAAARALLGMPELLIADEPTSSLDAEARESFLTLLMEECSEAGAALLFVSHDHSLSPLFDRTVSFASLNGAAA